MHLCLIPGAAGENNVTLSHSVHSRVSFRVDAVHHSGAGQPCASLYSTRSTTR